ALFVEHFVEEALRLVFGEGEILGLHLPHLTLKLAACFSPRSSLYCIFRCHDSSWRSRSKRDCRETSTTEANLAPRMIYNICPMWATDVEHCQQCRCDDWDAFFATRTRAAPA